MSNISRSFKKGDRVRYTPFQGCSKEDIEYGEVTSVSPIDPTFIFVRYDGDLHNKCTDINDLELVRKGKKVY